MFKETASASQLELALKESDLVQESLDFVDEVSLHRMGGFALFSCINGSNKGELRFLTALRLPQAEKETLPLNLKVLDKGGLTFMKMK